MQQHDDRPNILMVMSDEQRWDSLGVNGNRLSRTPSIDGLARDGATLDHCYVSYPLCCPSRMSLWTGLMPHDHRGFGNWRLLREDLRDDGLVHPFAQQGYHTIYNGKWHVPGSTPKRFGFADVEATPAVLNGLDRGRYIEDYRDYATAQGYELVPGNIENLTASDVEKLHEPGRAPCGTAEIPIEHYLEPWQTGRFLEQLDRRPENEPFFAVCSFNAPHFPMIVPAPYDHLIDPDSIELPENFCAGLDGKPREVTESRYREHGWPESEWRRLIAHYLGFCAMVDDQVERILTWLENAHLRENTIVVFVSDHGDMMGSHGLNKKGYPLHYEEALRVPLVMSGPGVKPGTRVDQLASLIDLVPTLADLCGVRLNEQHEGFSFGPAVRGDGSWSGRDVVISESFQFDGTESGNGDAIDPAGFDPARDGVNLSVRTHTHRYIFRLHDHDELYDMVDDPAELRNIRHEPGVEDTVSSLQRILHDAIADTFPEVAASIAASGSTHISA